MHTYIHTHAHTELLVLYCDWLFTVFSHWWQMKETFGVDVDTSEVLTGDVSSRLHGDYEAQVAAHLTLVQLRSFCHDLSRSLRAINTYRTNAA